MQQSLATQLRRSAGFLVSICFVVLAFRALAAPEEELKELRQRITALQRKLSANEESQVYAADALKASELAISRTRRDLFELARKQRQVEVELSALKLEMFAVQTDLKAQQALLEKLMRTHYTSGEPNVVALLLAGADAADTARRYQYYRYIAQARLRVISTQRASLARLNALSNEATSRNEDLRRIRAQQQQARLTLFAERDQHKQVWVRIADSVTRQRKQISSLRRDEARLTQLVEELGRVLTRRPARRQQTALREAGKHAGEQKARQFERMQPRLGTIPQAAGTSAPDNSLDASAFALLKGRLRLPTRGELAQHFDSPLSAKATNLTSLFIRSPEGQEVQAVAAGRVVFSDWLRGFGNLLIVDHGGGFMSVYGNNESLYKQVGDEAGEGETVASVGNSGGKKESGLYFELRFKGRPLDPWNWITK